VNTEQCECAAARDLPSHLLHERPREGSADDEDLPAGLHIDARLDEESGVLLDALLNHQSPRERCRPDSNR
jgi:hypothetical protein